MTADTTARTPAHSPDEPAFPWLNHYPDGVPHEIDLSDAPSLTHMILEACKTFADRPALQHLGTTLTYAQLDKLSAQFAAYCQTQLGLKQGQRLAIMLPNCLQYPVVMLGALRAGLVVVNLNPLYKASEIEFCLTNSGAKTLFVLENFAGEVEKALKTVPVDQVVVSRLGDLMPLPKQWFLQAYLKFIKKKGATGTIPGAISLGRALWHARKAQAQPVTLAHNDIAFLQYTGGTTGVPKAAILTHGNMVANVKQGVAWFGDALRPGKEVIITALPLYHIFSLTANCLMMMTVGAESLLITDPRDIPHLISVMAKRPFTCFTGVNTLFDALLQQDSFRALDFSSLRLVFGGGMPVHRSTAKAWHEVTSTVLLEGYGLTEASPIVSINPVNLEAYNGTIGLPIPSTQVSLRDDNWEAVPAGEPGELCVKGPQVMQGYWKSPKETANVLSRDGWLRTGDIATLDDKGFITIVDRKKDMINVSGFKVFPNEVEQTLSHMPGVAEVGVIGIPDEHSGEVVKAFIVKKDPTLSSEDVIHYAHQQLTGYKIPREVEFVDSLPKSPVGKILRKDLR